MLIKVEGIWKTEDTRIKQKFCTTVTVLDNRIMKVHGWLPYAIEGKPLDYLINWCSEQGFSCKLIKEIKPGVGLWEEEG